jgi:hypothetical protein
MGCYDIYCVICGITTGIHWYENDFENLEDILDKGKYNLINKKTYKELKKEKEIDKDLIENYRKFIKDVNKIKSKFNWCKDTCLITNKNVINTSNLVEDVTGNFYNKHKDSEPLYITQKDLWGYYKPENRALICHKSCYKLLSEKLNYKLESDNISNKLNRNSLLQSYGTIVDKYTSMQEFPWIGMIINNHFFWYDLLEEKKKLKISNNINFLMNPLKNEKNESRIIKIWKPIVNQILKKKIIIKKDRPSPSESATLFELGKKKRGNDGNMYIIVVNKNGVKRWKKVN